MQPSSSPSQAQELKNLSCSKQNCLRQSWHVCQENGKFLPRVVCLKVGDAACVCMCKCVHISINIIKVSYICAYSVRVLCDVHVPVWILLDCSAGASGKRTQVRTQVRQSLHVRVEGLCPPRLGRHNVIERLCLLHGQAIEPGAGSMQKPTLKAPPGRKCLIALARLGDEPSNIQ